MHRIYLATKKANPITLQNALLTTSDVDLALVFYDLPPEESAEILRAAGPMKAKRVQEELDRMTRVKVQGKDLLRFQDAFLLKIQGRKVPPTRRYFRPNV